MTSLLSAYVAAFSSVLNNCLATRPGGAALPIDEAIEWAVQTAKATHAAGNKLMFIGNGGSAGISSHLAIDFSKNGNVRSTAFNDGAALTCLGNDLGYENVFAKQIELHARAKDLLIAISSSGKSPNILRGVAAARRAGCAVLTLSGFDADNPLRNVGDVNVFVPSRQYGFVEIAHLTWCHVVVDRICGWKPAVREPAASRADEARTAGGRAH